MSLIFLQWNLGNSDGRYVDSAAARFPVSGKACGRAVRVASRPSRGNKGIFGNVALWERV